MIKINSALCNEANRIKIPLLVFGRARVDNTWNGTVISPSYSRLYYITGGFASITLINGKTITLKPLRWYLLPSGCSFSFECKEQMEHIYFHLKISSLDEADLLRNCPVPISLDDPSLNPEFLTDYLDVSDTLSCIYVHQFIERVLFSLLSKNKIHLETRDFSPCVKRAIKYINRNLTLNLSNEDVLKEALVSKSTLTKRFREEMGMSLHEYLFDKIMFEAEQLLRQNELSIGEISEKFKFYDQFYFSRCFKARFGLSPTEYRKTNII